MFIYPASYNKAYYDPILSFFFLLLQGYLPVEASVLDVEVWGLGGEATRRQQDRYKKRENIFSEQRRKVLFRANLNYSLCIFAVKVRSNTHDTSHFSFRLISKPLATGKTLQRKWWWIWWLIRTGFGGKIVRFGFTGKKHLPVKAAVPVQIRRTWELMIVTLHALWRCREVVAHICFARLDGPHAAGCEWIRKRLVQNIISIIKSRLSAFIISFHGKRGQAVVCWYLRHDLSCTRVMGLL